MINTKYQIISITPYRRSNFQPFKWVANTKNITVDSKDTVEYVRPGNKRTRIFRFIYIRQFQIRRTIRELNLSKFNSILMILPRLVTFTCEPGCIIAVCINQGSPRQTRISKTLLPTALLTAMSPSPSLITANDERASGTLTPAATNVKPIIVSGIPRVLPMEYRISAIKRKKRNKGSFTLLISVGKFVLPIIVIIHTMM